jgi:hypothetical protein
MELDPQSLFVRTAHWLRPRNPPPRIWAHIRRRYWSPKIDDISLLPPGYTERYRRNRTVHSTEYMNIQCIGRDETW